MSGKTRARLAAQIASDIQKAHPILKDGKKVPNPLAAGTLENGGRARVDEVCPTGHAVVDHHVLRVGGLPKGRVYEVGGAEGAGKTTFVCGVMAEAQRDGMQVVLTDKENKFHAGWAQTVGRGGLSLADTIEYPAETVEDYAQEMLRLMSKFGSRTQFMFVLDSVPPLLPEKALKDGNLRDVEIPGVQAAAWSRWLAALTNPLLETKSILILINQLRSKVGVMFGPTEDTPAGRAIKHYATCRFMVMHGKGIEAPGEEGGKVKIGRYMKVAAFKNGQTGISDAVELKLLRETGFDDRWSVCEFAKRTGRLAKSAEPDEKHYLEAMANLNWPLPAPLVVPEKEE